MVLPPSFRNPPTPFRPEIYNGPNFGGGRAASALPLKRWFVRKTATGSVSGDSNSLTPEMSGTDGTCTTGTKNFSSPTAAFTQAHVGRCILVANSGNKYYRIVTVTDATHVIVSQNFTSTVSGTATWGVGGAFPDLTLILGNSGNAVDAMGEEGFDHRIYVGAGSYRNVYTLKTGSSAGLSRFFHTYIGDTYGFYTGDAGAVILTAYVTSDVSAPSGSNILTANTITHGNRAFENIIWICGTQGAAIITATAGFQYRKCVFFAPLSNANMLTFASVGAFSNYEFDSCVFHTFGNAAASISISALLSSGNDYDVGIVFKNCAWTGGNTGNAVTFTVTGGTGTGKPGGVKMVGCSSTVAPFLRTNSANCSVNVPCTVYGCVIAAAGVGPGLSATTLGQIVEDYNYINTSTARTNVNVGLHSQTTNYAPLFNVGQEIMYGGRPRAFLEPWVGGGVSTPISGMGHYDTSTGPLDAKGAPRPSTPTSLTPGAYAIGNNFVKETTTVDAGTNAISCIGPGYQDFDVAVDAGTVTITAKCRFDGTYSGPLPSLMVVGAMGVGVGDSQVEASKLSLNAFQTLTLQINPSSAGIITVRVVSRDVSLAGKCIFDTFAFA